MDLVGLICLHGVVKVLLTSPTTPTDRMKAIVEAAGLVRPFAIYSRCSLPRFFFYLFNCFAT